MRHVPPNDYSSRLDLALAAARRAGEITLQRFGTASLGTETKHDGSPVTLADKEAEAAIRDMVTRTFPHDAVLGEEHGEQPGTSGYRWVLDPIDGTRSFICGVPLYGTLVGVEREGQPVVGVIHMPALDETAYAAKGGGAWHLTRDSSPRPARCSTIDRLDRAVLSTTSISYYRDKGGASLYERVCNAAGHSRGWSDCYGFLLLATGRIDAVVEPHVHPWDVAAVVPIIEEAGGRCTDFAGRSRTDTGNCLATNGRVHQELLELLC